MFALKEMVGKPTATSAKLVLTQIITTNRSALKTADLMETAALRKVRQYARTALISNGSSNARQEATLGDMLADPLPTISPSV